jgi:molecular chaperone DnaK (HSP70)
LFLDDNRLVGEEALPELMHENIVMFFSLLSGKKYDDIKSKTFIPHTKLRLSEISSGGTGVAIKHCGNEEIISVTAVLGVFLTQVASEIQNSLDRSAKVGQLYCTAFSLELTVCCIDAIVGISRIS